jgi:membrane protein
MPHPVFHGTRVAPWLRAMKKYLPLFKQTFREFGEDKAPRLGAALAYYTIFSIAPLLMISIAIAGMVLGDEAAQGGITDELGKVMGPQSAQAIEEMIQNANKPKAGAVATIVGILTLLFGASGVFNQLKDALNTIWNIEPKKASGVWGFIRSRFLSMAMVMVVAFLLLVSLVIDAAITGMSGYLERVVPGGATVLQIVQLIVSFAIITVLFAMIFRYLPDKKIPWRDLWLGSAITSLLFVLGKFALGLYLGKAAPGSSFGAAGSLVVLLVWVYWSAQILFLGAEFTQVYARTFGSMAGDTSKTRAKQQAGRVEDRPKSGAPAYAGSKGKPQKAKGGGAGKLVGGGIAGLLVGTLLGVVTGLIVAVKSVKKLVTMPFK